MGALISLIKPSGKDEPVPDINVDLLKATPLPEETELFNLASVVLGPSHAHLESLKSYSGCGEYIRKAISQPSPETEKGAWDALCPAVLKLKEFYEFSLSLQDLFPRTMKFFMQGDPLANLGKYQATVKKLCDVLYFVSLFDELKMGNPHVQNDFSYYRRSLAKMKGQTENLAVNDDLANRMSLFYAYASPMNKALIDSLVQQKSATPISEIIALIAAVCYNAVDKLQAQSPSMVEYCLRVLVVSIILYDNINLEGAFGKNSKISIRSSVKAIKTYGGSNKSGLMNALKYSTVHLNDETTPKNIKSLILDD